MGDIYANGTLIAQDEQENGEEVPVLGYRGQRCQAQLKYRTGRLASVLVTSPITSISQIVKEGKTIEINGVFIEHRSVER